MGRFGATETLFLYKGSLKAHSGLQESPGSLVCKFVNYVYTLRHTCKHTQTSAHSHTHTFHQEDRSSKMDKVPTIYAGAEKKERSKAISPLTLGKLAGLSSSGSWYADKGL